MRYRLPAILIISGLIASTSVDAAEVIIGDSIGVGLSMASGARSLAHNSVAIRGGDTMSQLAKVTRGDIGVLSLGTNDAVGTLAGVGAAIDRLVGGIEKSGVRIIWMGPPCVLKKWNVNVERLDRALRERLQSTSITYVSVADQAICDRSLRAPDGVHFNMRGYATLWSRVAAVGGFPEHVKGGAKAPVLKKRLSKKKRKVETDRSLPVHGMSIDKQEAGGRS